MMIGFLVRIIVVVAVKITVCMDNIARIWGCEFREKLNEIQQNSTITLSGSETSINIRFDAPKVKISPTESGDQLIKTIEVNDLMGAGFIKDTKIATNNKDKQQEYGMAKSGEQLKYLTGMMILLLVGISTDGQRVVTGSKDKTAKVWDTESEDELLSLIAHDDIVTSVGFSPDGKWILTAGLDKKICIWNAVSGEKLNILTHNEDLKKF